MGIWCVDLLIGLVFPIICRVAKWYYFLLQLEVIAIYKLLPLPSPHQVGNADLTVILVALYPVTTGGFVGKYILHGVGPGAVEFLRYHFQASTFGDNSIQSPELSRDWEVVLTAVEVESLRSEIAALEEREAHLKAQLEHIDEILQSARLSGYLFVRTRWAALPGEPLPIDDDTEVDDWLPRFLVLQGSCIFLYSSSTDLSPQDSTLLSDVVEVGALPCLTREDGETRYCFYISTRHGLRYECFSVSKIQVDSWLATLQNESELQSNSTAPDELTKT
ncbi:PREDICTED: uncharacterized protein LOC109239247 [Nicotiana attenuata]|uniref:uncharacterized protein LOC109239247 n=1 Tax=Nicotiana attenuata TaxID=49451 RepID=UPI0009051416|nr:PREDICTED: uncharacterized protein LOC109239247 [Nicotiana attenuata]